MTDEPHRRMSDDPTIRNFLIDFASQMGSLSAKQDQAIQEIHKVHSGVCELERRVDDLEKSRSWLMGGFAAVMFLVSSGGLAIYQKLTQISADTSPQVERVVKK